jgi:hypothetical protein
MPTRGFLWRSLDDSLQGIIFSLGRGLIPTVEGPCLVANPSEDFVHDFRVGAMMRDINDLVKSMIDERFANVVDHSPVGLAG